MTIVVVITTLVVTLSSNTVYIYFIIKKTYWLMMVYRVYLLCICVSHKLKVTIVETSSFQVSVSSFGTLSRK